MALAYIPIGVRKVAGVNAAFPNVNRFPEKSGQTFKLGVPLQFNGGYLQESAAINDATDAIVGIGTDFGANLSSDGVAKTLNLSITPPNQPSAVITPIGSPPNDGMTGVILLGDNPEFYAVFLSSHTSVVTDIGALYGLTKDGGTGQWYIDTTITTVNAGGCLRITELIDPAGTVGGRAAFLFENVRDAFRN